MTEEKTTIPSLPTYAAPQGIRPATNKEQGPLMKLMGKMMAKKLPKLMGIKGKISPSTIKIGHKKKKDQVKFY